MNGSRRAAPGTTTALAALALFVLSMAGCSNGPPPAEAGPKSKESEVMKWEEFDASNFDSNSMIIDNEWHPMKPGMRWVWDGTTIDDEGESMEHQIQIHVTDLTKVIGGVRAAVTWDLDYSAGELVEAELAFLAQDKEGNVWRMGEYPVEYEDGEIIDAPTWIHGYEDAVAGIMMWAKPKEGTRSYAQGWGPEVDWTDRGQVHKMGDKVSTPFADYDDVLAIAETSLSEPGAMQLKYYARGVGNVAVGWQGESDPNKETLKLVEFEMMSSEKMAEVREKAMELETHAYGFSKNVYAKTSPSEPLESMGTK